MKAVTFTASVPRYLFTTLLGFINKQMQHGRLSCVSYGDVPEPALPGDDWVKVKTTYAGVCGSDLSMVFLHDTPTLSPFASQRFVMGHENVGVIVEAGSAVKDFSVGDRVVADIMMPCDTRGVGPCPNCQAGEYHICKNFEAGALAPGTILGTCATSGGSWSEYFVAHQAHLAKVPDGVDDKQAVLADPICSALHPVSRNMPTDDEKVLVIGAGIIGLMTVACLRACGSKADITVMARHKYQADLAMRYGADRVVRGRVDAATLPELAGLTGGKVLQPMMGEPYVIGGFQRVFDCVGTQRTVIDAIRFLDSGGTVVMVGLPTIVKMDWSLLWFKEATVKTSYCYGNEVVGNTPGKAVEHALRLIAQGKIDTTPLVTHVFDLADYRDAIVVASTKKAGNAVKVVLKP